MPSHAGAHYRLGNRLEKKGARAYALQPDFRREKITLKK